MKIKWQIVLAIFIVLLGAGGQIGYDFYYKPYIAAKPVVKVKVSGADFLTKNYKLTSKDIYIDKVPIADLPAGYLKKLDDAVNKIINVNLTNGTILTSSLVDVDDIQPGKDEGIFPIPKNAIYAINGSLRSRDLIDIYLISDKDKKVSVDLNKNNVVGSNGPKVSDNQSVQGKPFLEKVKVVHVRSDNNNDVKDTEKGNVNNRETSTNKVTEPEIKLDREKGAELATMIEQGYKLWIVRVE